MKDFQYLHGFDKKEQERLLHQGEFLEPYVFSGIELEFQKEILEVGCGVGAQTQILCRRFPRLNLTCVDLSDKQLADARKNLRSMIQQKRVKLVKQDAQKLKLPKKDYDAAFVCWFLEHVPKPLTVLQKIRQHLKKGAKIYCTEVFNQTLFIEPYSPAFLKYWFQFNDLQWTLKGHPFVGASLGNLLTEAGFHDVQVEVRPFHFDSREPEKRAAFVEEFYQILLSAERTLVETGRVSLEDCRQMEKEVAQVKRTKDSVFFYSYMRATGRA